MEYACKEQEGRKRIREHVNLSKGPAWAMRPINVISINVASVGSESINVILMNMVSHQSSMR